jgi:hypothetical protein
VTQSPPPQPALFPCPRADADTPALIEDETIFTWGDLDRLAAREAGVERVRILDADFHRWLAAQPSEWRTGAPGGGVMAYTSGTTGRPRASSRRRRAARPSR